MAEQTAVDGTTQTESPEPEPALMAAVTIDGKQYAPGKLTMADIGDLRVWVRLRRPDPFDAIRGHIDGMPAELQRAMIDDALAEIRRPVVYGDLEFMAALQSKEGLREALWYLLRRGGASITREQSDAAADSLGLVEAFGMIARVFDR
jgi:hypothetical protein